jgi:hypothetical protein
LVPGLALLALLAAFFYCPGFSITTVEVSGQQLVPAEELRELAESSLAGYYAGLLPRRHLLFYPRSEIAQKIRAAYPAIVGVELRLQNWNQLVVTVKERSSNLLWCASASLPNTKDCYFMDEGGLVFASAPAFAGGTYEEIYAPFSGSPVGKRYLLARHLQAIRQVEAGLLEIMKRSPLASSTVERVYYLGRDELSLTILDSSRLNRWSLKLSIAGPIPDILSNFDSVVTADVFEKDFIKNKGRLEYFDLRYGRKVYYRFR